MEEQYPLLKHRIQSTLIDFLFIVALLLVFSFILEQFDTVPDWIRISVFGGLFIAYEPICTSVGSTLGNYLKGIRVRKNSDSTKRINILQAIIRYIIKILLGWISFVTIISNPKGRAIHDLISGSLMIKHQQD